MDIKTISIGRIAASVMAIVLILAPLSAMARENDGATTNTAGTFGASAPNGKLLLNNAPDTPPAVSADFTNTPTLPDLPAVPNEFDFIEVPPHAPPAPDGFLPPQPIAETEPLPDEYITVDENVTGLKVMMAIKFILLIGITLL